MPLLSVVSHFAESQYVISKSCETGLSSPKVDFLTYQSHRILAYPKLRLCNIETNSTFQKGVDEHRSFMCFFFCFKFVFVRMAFVQFCLLFFPKTNIPTPSTASAYPPCPNQSTALTSYKTKEYHVSKLYSSLSRSIQTLRTIG